MAQLAPRLATWQQCDPLEVPSWTLACLRWLGGEKRIQLKQNRHRSENKVSREGWPVPVVTVTASRGPVWVVIASSVLTVTPRGGQGLATLSCPVYR